MVVIIGQPLMLMSLEVLEEVTVRCTMVVIFAPEEVLGGTPGVVMVHTKAVVVVVETLYPGLDS